ncbi:hypothetical protein [Lutibacter flavus]|jgi:hypothetical protein|uniref:Uncharacterized protein n=1 Tax=Lutibacter flavus TaxID=691689 RepID=A0A238VKJ9_9FLAO|nr:hypothetical protein [Lutibacter flavus]SNR34756.1 hypothetical protein SAMN04488111_0632 [Lutibacter flavus]
MKTEIPDIEVLFPNEDSAKSRKLILENESEYLQISAFDNESKEDCVLVFNENQLTLLRDQINVFLKNKLLDKI